MRKPDGLTTPFPWVPNCIRSSARQSSADCAKPMCRWTRGSMVPSQSDSVNVAASSGLLFLDRVGRHQSPSLLDRHSDTNMHFSHVPAKGAFLLCFDWAVPLTGNPSAGWYCVPRRGVVGVVTRPKNSHNAFNFIILLALSGLRGRDSQSPPATVQSRTGP
jgi:hypothetical protein